MNTILASGNPFVDYLKTNDIDSREQLKHIMKERVLQQSDKTFKLASGVTSSEYFNMKNLGIDGLALTTAILYKMLQKTGAASIGGLESGAIPLSVAISCMSCAQGDSKPLEWFYVRKEPKSHGMGNKIEGKIKSPVMVLDDVVTSGGSALKAIHEIKEQNMEYIGIICVMFRGSQENRKKLEEEGDFKYIFSQNDLQNV